MDSQDIEELARAEFRSKITSIEKISEGLRHPTFRIEANGNYILQVAGKGKGKEKEIRRTFKAYQLLKDRSIPVPVPVNLSEGEINGEIRTYSIVENIEGVSLEKRGLNPEIIRECGRLLAEIHGISEYDNKGWLKPEENSFSVVSYPEGSSKKHRLRGWRESIETFREQGWKKLGRELQDFYGKYSGNFPDEFHSVFCHNDFSADNIILKQSRINGVIDFDYAHAGHNQRDLVKAANSLWMQEPGAEWSIRETLYKGYREEGGLCDSFKQNEPLYRVETLVGTVASLLEMDELTDEEKEFYRENLCRLIQEADEELQNV